MTEPTKAEKCRVISEWLEPFASLPAPTSDWDDEPTRSPLKAWERYMIGVEPQWQPRNFYLDEAASFAILKAILFISLHSQVNVGWRVVLPDGTCVDNRDLLTAIADAAYAYAMQLIAARKEKA